MKGGGGVAGANEPTFCCPRRGGSGRIAASRQFFWSFASKTPHQDKLRQVWSEGEASPSFLLLVEIMFICSGGFYSGNEIEKEKR
jgi:hypothetical protein